MDVDIIEREDDIEKKLVEKGCKVIDRELMKDEILMEILGLSGGEITSLHDDGIVGGR